MKDLRLRIKVNKPIEAVFEFVINPNNTPRWIDSIVYEEADSDPVTHGTTFRNQDSKGQINVYTVTRYEPPRVFQLDALHQDYKLRYTFTPISENETELEYYEWSESGQLHAPFMQKIIDKLKEVMETE
jgi:hypothetical protein